MIAAAAGRAGLQVAAVVPETTPAPGQPWLRRHGRTLATTASAPALLAGLVAHATVAGPLAAVGLAPGPGVPQRYSKRHLVPFGEFIPWGFRWFVDLMRMPIGDQQRGAAVQPPMELAGQRIAVNICYEDLFGEVIISAWDGSAPPTILLNMSNLAWFRDSLALPQHHPIC